MNGKQITVAPVEFIRRFLLNVLPDGFPKIRHYGLHASSNVHTKLAAAERHLAVTTSLTMSALS
jgi:Putative transposase